MLDTNDIITRKVVNMEDLHNQKVVEHNDLITSVAKMDKIPLKIFELAVSCLDVENPPKDNGIYISKEILFRFFDVKSENKHTRFKQAIDKMQKQAYFEIREQKGKGYQFQKIVPIPTVRWNDYDDEVFMRFNQDIIPYLLDLKRNFTQYLITDIMELTSKYSVIIYKWLSLNYNQYETYKENGQRREEQLELLKNPYIDIQELRRMTDTVDDYKRFGNFEKRVLEVATDEISKFTHFNVSYKKVKNGRSIVGIKFSIDKIKSKAPVPYKENSDKAKESIEQKEKEDKEIYDNALKSKYVIALVEHDLIKSVDILNVSFMVNLANTLFPLYDTIQNLRGLDGVIGHISYVKGKMIDYEDNKKNILKYLKNSAKGYISLLKTKDI